MPLRPELIWGLAWLSLPPACAYVVALPVSRLSTAGGAELRMVVGSLLFLGAFTGLRAMFEKEAGVWRGLAGRALVAGGTLAVTLFGGLLLLAGSGSCTWDLLAAILVAAATEEIVFRHHLPRLVEQRMRPGMTRRILGPLVSQSAFVLSHVIIPGNPWAINPRGLIILLGSGYFYLLLYRATSTLGMSIAVHALVNTNRLGGGGRPLAGLWLWWALLGAVCAVLLFLGRRHPSAPAPLSVPIGDVETPHPWLLGPGAQGVEEQHVDG